jgi:hypothetical protein
LRIRNVEERRVLVERSVESDVRCRQVGDDADAGNLVGIRISAAKQKGVVVNVVVVTTPKQC